MSAAVIAMIGRMTRWGPDAKGRLVQSALELYAKRGYDQTTVAEIAERAGLTERAFCRHFADKKEVLFAGSNNLRNVLVTAVAERQASAAPIGAGAAGLPPVVGLFKERGRAHSRPPESVAQA